jgi:hypothetical protein
VMTRLTLKWSRDQPRINFGEHAGLTRRPLRGLATAGDEGLSIRMGRGNPCADVAVSFGASLTAETLSESGPCRLSRQPLTG